MRALTCPLLSEADAAAWEKRLLGGDATRELAAMEKAGGALARALLRDLPRAPTPERPLRVLALLGKGHNAGDALFALAALAKSGVAVQTRLVFALGGRLRQNAKCALDAFRACGAPCEVREWAGDINDLSGAWDVALDGVFGLSFRAGVSEECARLFAAVNAHENIALRAAVDMPSGLCDATAGDEAAPILRADYTYQTGIPKRSAFAENRIGVVGRLRYLDLGFFNGGTPESRERLIEPKGILRALCAPRPALCDKRGFGRCAVFSGSPAMAGAHLLNVRAALRAGAGLVAAFAPPHAAAAFCAREPAAMWAPQRRDRNGELAPDAAAAFLARLERASAALLGSGMGISSATRRFLREVAARALCPLVLDADALFPDILEARRAEENGALQTVLTPHAGEYARINPDGADLLSFARAKRAVVVLKGARTRVCDGEAVYYNITGGPALARGGSGDVLSGLIAGLLAQTPPSPLFAAAAGAAWHGSAADEMERALGQRACTADDLPDFLSRALKSAENDCVK